MPPADHIVAKDNGSVVVLTCCAPYGVGGLGRTLSDTADTLCADGQPFRSTFPKEGGIQDSCNWVISRAS